MSGETENNVSGWTTDTLHAHVDQTLRLNIAHQQRQMDDLRGMLQERYEAQTKAIDAAFLAQQTAMQAALQSAEKAVVKAELGADKRFESVNEFRGQLADQANTFMPRAEAENRANANAGRIGEIEVRMEKYLTRTESDAAMLAGTQRQELILARLGALELRVTSRLDLSQGAATGADQHRTDQRQLMTILVGAIGLVVAILAVALPIYIASKS